jgi:multiple sugar transport system permease protein
MTLASDQLRQAPPQVAPAVARRRGRRALGGWWLYLALLGGLVLVVGPFVWMVLGSFKPQPEFLRTPPTWIPEAPTLDNYRRLFDFLDFPRFFTNSAIVAIAVTAGNLVFCSMVGYALAKLRFAGRDKVFVLVLATMMVPGSVTVVPLYILMSILGLTNSFGGLILPFLATAFGVFLMRQFMLGIPDELLEAARIDGASEMRTFWQVVFPLATPALATLGILTFLGSWNSFFWPLIVATEEEMYTLPVALATFATGQYQADHGLLMAGSLIIVLPVLIVFILLQRLFTQGIATTGIKG